MTISESYLSQRLRKLFSQECNVFAETIDLFRSSSLVIELCFWSRSVVMCFTFSKACQIASYKLDLSTSVGLLLAPVDS